MKFESQRQSITAFFKDNFVDDSGQPPCDIAYPNISFTRPIGEEMWGRFYMLPVVTQRLGLGGKLAVKCFGICGVQLFKPESWGTADVHQASELFAEVMAERQFAVLDWIDSSIKWGRCVTLQAQEQSVVNAEKMYQVNAFVRYRCDIYTDAQPDLPPLNQLQELAVQP